MVFWLVAGALAVIVALIVIAPLIRARGRAEGGVARFDIAIYRDQLAEVDRDVERGRLSASEAEQTRLEIKRRILEADRAGSDEAGTAEAARPLSLVTGIVVVLALLGGTAGTYLAIGAPGAGDMPLKLRRERAAEISANRPSQEVAEAEIGNATELADAASAEYRDLVARLRETAAARGGDIQGQMLLAQHEARLGNFAAARIAQGNVVALKGDAATGEDFTDLAELMIIAAGGYVSPQAEQALSAALRLTPDNPRTRYYSGLDLAQNGRADVAYQVWMKLLQDGPPDAPWIAPILEQINDVANLAGLPPPDLPGRDQAPLAGPSAEDMDAAGAQSAEDRDAMVRGMVAQLSERLAAEGGSAAEWAQLIRAYGVLGEADLAAAAWKDAQAALADNPAGLAEAVAAARDAGVAD
ncbi:MAG: c-type cytochrome biogenesis protein CcmI [Rhodobacteraceae bacterium]|nr:c-type cytochrome biogenesis protein CcmI [Paracoccaceae bacterium]